MNEGIKHTIGEFLRKNSADYVAIFGSYARGEEGKESDIDILVNFPSSIGLLRLVGLQQDLSEILGRKVDLVTKGALKNQRLITSIKKDLIEV